MTYVCHGHPKPSKTKDRGPAWQHSDFWEENGDGGSGHSVVPRFPRVQEGASEAASKLLPYPCLLCAGLLNIFLDFFYTNKGTQTESLNHICASQS